jgi:hypothetical protein
MSQQKIYPTPIEIEKGFIERQHPHTDQVLKKDLGGKRFVAGEKIEVECGWCSEKKLINPSKLKHGWKFCSNNCKLSYGLLNKYTDIIGKKVRKIEVVCNNPLCLREFKLLPSFVREKNYCCVKCSEIKLEFDRINTADNRLEQRIHLEEGLKKNIWFLSGNDNQFDINDF